MPLVIKKKITLENIGEGAYLEFRAIPVGDVAEIQNKMPKEDDEDKTAAIPFMLELLKKYFIGGKAPDEKGQLSDVTADDLDNLDASTAVEVFQGLSGVDPKDEGQSKISSTPSTQTE